MAKNKITEKLFKIIEEGKEVELTDDFKVQLDETFQTLVKEEKEKFESKLLIKEGEVKELKEILHEAKEAIEAKNDEIKKIKEVTLETVKEEVEEYKEDLVSKLDSFLESEIKDVVPENVIEALAKIEIYEPIVEGIKATFASKNIEFGSESHETLIEAKTEIENLRKDVNKAIEEKNSIEKKAEELLVKYVLKEKCEGMTPDQIDRIEKIFKGDNIESIEEKFDSVRDLVIESKSNEEDNEDIIDESGEPEGGVVNEEDLGQEYL